MSLIDLVENSLWCSNVSCMLQQVKLLGHLTFQKISDIAVVSCLMYSPTSQLLA